MPSLQKNLRTWDETYAWSRGGDDWSDRWGAQRICGRRSYFPGSASSYPLIRFSRLRPALVGAQTI
jgi:hypothetical protein